MEYVFIMQSHKIQFKYNPIKRLMSLTYQNCDWSLWKKNRCAHSNTKGIYSKVLIREDENENQLKTTVRKKHTKNACERCGKRVGRFVAPTMKHKVNVWIHFRIWTIKCINICNKGNSLHKNRFIRLFWHLVSFQAIFRSICSFCTFSHWIWRNQLFFAFLVSPNRNNQRKEKATLTITANAVIIINWAAGIAVFIMPMQVVVLTQMMMV